MLHCSMYEYIYIYIYIDRDISYIYSSSSSSSTAVLVQCGIVVSTAYIATVDIFLPCTSSGLRDGTECSKYIINRVPLETTVINSSYCCAIIYYRITADEITRSLPYLPYQVVLYRYCCRL
jgi:hypothetical protein